MVLDLIQMGGSRSLYIPEAERSIVGIPRRIEAAFSSAGRQKVVLVVLDGLGSSLLQKVTHLSGEFSRLLAGAQEDMACGWLPTKTAAMLNCLHTGLSPLESAFINWGDLTPERLSAYSEFGFRNISLMQELHAQGVNVHIMQPEGIPFRPERRAVLMPHVNFIEYPNFAGIQAELGTIVQQSARDFVFLYSDFPDSVSHRYGPESETTQAAVACFLEVFSQQILEPLIRTGTLLLLSADHGQVQYGSCIDVKDALIEAIESFDVSNIVLHGQRFVFLRVNDPRRVVAQLQESLGEYAFIREIHECIEKGLFGVFPDNREELSTDPLVSNAGNVLILAEENFHFSVGDDFPCSKHRGGHGSLTRDELTVPLIIWGDS